MERDSFPELFKILRNADLFGKGPQPIGIDLKNAKSLRTAIDKGAANLPALYHDTYVSPLLKNLKWVMKKISKPSLETLAGAVYDHTADYGNPIENIMTKRRLRGFLAVISNLYRSFLELEPSAKFASPKPRSIPPPLATFRPILNIDKREYGPFTLPIDEVERLCGGKVAVVSLPSSYRHHPVLCWGSIAHEVGGHDILHAYPGLLLELQQGVRKLFYHGPDPNGTEPENDEQFLGLLWQYWTEEAASDVCAILNLGPAYGMGVAVFLSAFNERISRKNGPMGTEPRLTVSWPPPNSNISHVDSHPTDILKLNVIIGAIEALHLDGKVKTKYLNKIRACIDYSIKLDENEKNLNKNVEISGTFSFKPGKLLKVLTPKKILRTTMEEHARRVGRFIASEPLKSLNGNNLQDLETWDEADEALAQDIQKDLLKPGEPTDPFDSYLGDDPQLLAGSLLALFEKPDQENYEKINKWLVKALEISWYYDPIWGQPSWHPFVGGYPKHWDDMDDELKKLKKSYEKNP